MSFGGGRDVRVRDAATRCMKEMISGDVGVYEGKGGWDWIAAICLRWADSKKECEKMFWIYVATEYLLWNLELNVLKATSV